MRGRSVQRLTYWVAPCRTDRSCYNIRRRTRKAVLDELAKIADGDFGPPIKHVVTYTGGAFGLLCELLGEGGQSEPHGEGDA